MNDRFEEIKDEIESIERQLAEITPQVADARRKAFSKDATDEDRERLKSLELKGGKIADKLSPLIAEAQEIAGIPEKVLQTIENIKIGGDSIESTQRELLTHDKLSPTDQIEDSLSESLELLKSVVDQNWLNEQRGGNHRLGQQYLIEPISIVRGVRVESEYAPVHRFAQGLLVAEDFLEGVPDYDFWGGALLVPQICSLGKKFPALKEVKGEVAERISSLWNGNSEQADSTVFELLVAASCTLFGRDMEFLSASDIKTPDLRVHSYRMPLVVECKRKQVLSEYDLLEEKHMRHLFAKLHAACSEKGMNGIINLKMKVETNSLPLNDVIKIATSLRFNPFPGKELEYEWGQISFQPLQSRINIHDTNLYSPNFLKWVFGLNIDLPEYDGFICKVNKPDDMIVNIAKNPFALIWSNFSAESIKRKTWTVTSSFGKATKQVPPGEVGIIYLCFQEGTTPEHADKKINLLSSQLEGWAHTASIRLPINFAIRLLPRPLFEGAPDLIENGYRFCSQLYGDPSYFADFPTCVFQNQLPITTDQIFSDLIEE